jgi:cytochrome c peroxidase
MRLPALGAAIAFACFASLGSHAADVDDPDPYFELPEYVPRGSRIAPPQDYVARGSRVVPPQDYVARGSRVVPPQDYVGRGSRVAPPQDIVAPAPTPRLPPRESAPRTSPPPQVTCNRVWRCEDYECGWKSVCKPRPEPAPAPAAAPVPERYGSPRPPAAVPQVRPVPRLEPVVLAPAPIPAIETRAGNPLVLLGQRLFHDTRLSRTGRTACAVCHNPAYAYAQPRQVAQQDNGQPGKRNVPSLLNAGFLPALMWDGRFRSLEQQASGPFSTGEMGIDIAEAVRRLAADREYVYLFAAAFNERPSANAMAAALAAYQRTISAGTSRFDRYIANNRAVALTRMELDGYSMFQTTAGCSNCHQLQPTVNRRPSELRLFTDFGYHNLGIGYASGRFADPGRYRVTGVDTDFGAFRTPSLRNVAVTPPYMHDGSLATLEEVINYYDVGGRPNPYLSPFIRPLDLDQYEKAALLAFLRTLTDQQYEPRPVDRPTGLYSRID